MEAFPCRASWARAKCEYRLQPLVTVFERVMGLNSEPGDAVENGTQIALTAPAGRHSICEAWLVDHSPEGNTHGPQHEPAQHDPPFLQPGLRGRHLRIGSADHRQCSFKEGSDLNRDRRLFAPFVVAAERKIFEKYDLETSFKPFDDGNVALNALLTGSSDIGATTELGGLSRWDKGGKLYVTSYSSTSRQQMGTAAR